MPIRKHLTDKTALGPAAIEAMSKAFEEACIALQVYAGDEKGREIIATRIIDLARAVWLTQQHYVTASWQRRGLANRDIGGRQRCAPHASVQSCQHAYSGPRVHLSRASSQHPK